MRAPSADVAGVAVGPVLVPDEADAELGETAIAEEGPHAVPVGGVYCLGLGITCTEEPHSLARVGTLLRLVCVPVTAYTPAISWSWPLYLYGGQFGAYLCRSPMTVVMIASRASACAIGVAIVNDSAEPATAVAAVALAIAAEDRVLVTMCDSTAAFGLDVLSQIDEISRAIRWCS